MRTLPAPLAAQQSASAEPHVDVVVENCIGGIRRLDFTLLDNTAHTIAKHDVAVAGDGSVTRVRIESGAVKQQRVTNPASGPWTSWNNLATGMGAQVACAAKGARVAVVYVDAAGTGIKLRESTDNGATYAAEVAVTTAARRRRRSRGRLQEQQRRPGDRLGRRHERRHHQAHVRRVRLGRARHRPASAASTASR